MIEAIHKKTRFNIPDLPSAEDLLPYWKRIDAALWYSNFGPLIQEFQQGFTAEMEKAHQRPAGSLHAVCVNSGYNGLVVALKLMGVGGGTRVLVPAINFPAGPLAVENLGGETLLADVDPETWTLTPSIARAAAAQTQVDVVMPVAVYGIPLPVKEWDAFTRETGIPVVIDAAAAMGNQDYLETGLVVHSLHALKPMGVGEGGIIVGTDADLIDKGTIAINFGMIGRETVQNGMNAKISEYHAAVALAQLARWSEIKARRRRVFEMYQSALRRISDRFVFRPDFNLPVVSTLMLQSTIELPLDILGKLDKKDVCAHRTYFPPMYRHAHFSHLAMVGRDGRFKKEGTPLHERLPLMSACEALDKTILGVPFHAYLDTTDVDHIVSVLAEVC